MNESLPIEWQVELMEGSMGQSQLKIQMEITINCIHLYKFSLFQFLYFDFASSKSQTLVFSMLILNRLKNDLFVEILII